MTQTDSLRIIEAVLFAAPEPLTPKDIAQYLPPGANVKKLLSELKTQCAGRGIALYRYGNHYALRTAADLAPYLERLQLKPKRLSRAALEVLAIIAYHQPVTRAEIEAIRAVSLGHGTLDRLLETEWIRICGRRSVAGQPLEYGTSEQFLAQFHLADIDDLPDKDELRQTGFLEQYLRADDLLDDNQPPDNAEADSHSVVAMSHIPPASEHDS